MSNNNSPNNMPPPPEMPPPHEMGSFAAPIFPRKYLRRAEIIAPRPLRVLRPIYLTVGLLINLFLIFSGGLDSGPVAYALTGVTVFMHITILVFCAYMAARYYGIADKEGGESFSERTSKALRNLPTQIVLMSVASAGAYVYLALRFVRDEGGWFGLSVIVFLLLNIWMIRARVDTMSLLTKDCYISGLYRVRYGDVKELRMVGRALPGFGFNFKAERKVYFEAYGEGGKYLGRDQIYAGDYDRLEKIVKGLPLDTEYDKNASIRRSAPKKKKKNPNKKGK